MYCAHYCMDSLFNKNYKIQFKIYTFPKTNWMCHILFIDTMHNLLIRYCLLYKIFNAYNTHLFLVRKLRYNDNICKSINMPIVDRSNIVVISSMRLIKIYKKIVY